MFTVSNTERSEPLNNWDLVIEMVLFISVHILLLQPIQGNKLLFISFAERDMKIMV